jgi:signal transduction histidine kinase
MTWLRTSLARRIFLSYVLVIAAGAVTLFLVSGAVAPHILDQHMAGMMGGNGAGMMAGYADSTLRAAFRAAMVQSLLVAGSAAGVVAILSSLFISRQVAQPVQRMVQATRRIAAGEYSERLPSELDRRGDELAALATSFNEMAASLQQTEERRLALVGDVAHELRTPIAMLKGNLEGLLDGVVQATPETWAKLFDEAGRLERLVNDLQELSRAEAGQIALSLQPVSPDTIVRKAVDRLDSQFAEKDLHLSVTVASDLPPVQADLDRAVQVLTNLLTNALRYTPSPGQVGVGVSRKDDSVVFSVRDSGVGLSPEHLAHIFDRFYRVDKSRSRALGGAGIGLTIAKALVEGMGGDMIATSPGLGQGSRFTFSLPIAP